MDQILLFCFLGLGTGALTGAVAVALVVFYRGTGVINLAAGGVAMVAGFVFWGLLGGDAAGTGLPTWAALILTVAASAALGVMFEFLLFRPLRSSPPLAKLVGSLGALLVMQAAGLIILGGAPKTEKAILPTTAVNFAGIPVPVDHFILAGIVLAVSVGLAAFYRWSFFGLATRAAFESESAAMLVGLSPNRVSLVNSVIACLVAGTLGVLAAPLVTLDTQNLPLIVVPALAAALLANLTSVVGACLAGLAIGVAENLIYYASVQPWFPQDQNTPMPGVPDLLIFLVIVLVLFLRGSKLPGRGDYVERRLPAAPRARHILRPAVVAVVLCATALVVFPFDFRQALMNSLIGVILVLSLVVITGFVGQLSVMQLALSGAAGLVVSHLGREAGIGFPLALLAAAAAATVLGLVATVAALRVRGVTLVIVTLAAAVAIQNFVFNNATWGAGLTGAPVSQPSLFGLNLGNSAAFKGIDGQVPSPVLGFLILGITVLLCAFVANLRRSGQGMKMLAVRANERAAASVGISVRSVKLTAFGLGGFIAGVAGALYGYDYGGISASRFTALTAVSLIAFAYIAGITMVSGAVIAGYLAVAGLAQYALLDWFGLNGDWAILLGGIFVVVHLIYAPSGIAGALHARRARSRLREAGQPLPDSAESGRGLAGSVVGNSPEPAGTGAEDK